MVPRERLELSLCCQNGILNPARLPVPPPRPDKIQGKTAEIIQKVFAGSTFRAKFVHFFRIIILIRVLPSQRSKITR